MNWTNNINLNYGRGNLWRNNFVANNDSRSWNHGIICGGGEGGVGEGFCTKTKDDFISGSFSI